MLRKPRPLPERFNRRISRESQSLVKRRHRPKHQLAKERFRHAVHRTGRRIASARTWIVRYAAVGVGLTLLAIIGFAIFSPVLTVQEIRVARSDQRVDVEQVQQALLPLFGQHLLFLSAADVRELLAAAVPDLADVEIGRAYPSRLDVRLSLQPIVGRLEIVEPDAPAEQEEPAAGSGTIVVRDFLTADGLYVQYTDAQAAATLSGALAIRIVDWGVRPVPYMRLLDEELLAMMREAEQELRTDFALDVQERTVFVRAREFHLQTPSYALWFDRKSTVDEQLERYRIYMRTAGEAGATQYVDLRLRDKVVYR